MLTTNDDNPIPFKQPFIELHLQGDHAKDDEEGGVWWIDVGGKIDKYITKDNQPTELLIGLCNSLAKAGIIVATFQRYIGSGGPNVILRNGYLFNRMDHIEKPPESVFAYEPRMPKHLGKK